MRDQPTDDLIAIVGLAARLPGAADIDQFWGNLVAGREAVRFPSDDELLAAGVPADRLTDPDYIKAYAEAPGMDRFDAEFFGFTPREAAVLDPQIRMFLEIAHTAIENAGYDPDRIADGVGVYATTGINRYLDLHVRADGYAPPSAGHVAMSILSYHDYIATHVAYRFGFHGPALTVSTACSSSAVAVHLACQALRTGECDVALAGGSEMEMPAHHGYQWDTGGPLSPDGHCRPFDAAAAGTVFSSGAAAVVLKRLSDAMADGDHVWAVIRASAVNNDGASKAGFSAPGVAGQAAAIREATLLAGLAPGDVSYIEAHATGTTLGDPIEVAAFTKAYRGLGPDPADRIPLSSVKGNVGHLGHAAGIASLVKVALCLTHGQRVATANFAEPNPRLRLDETPFVVNDTTLPWPRRPGTPRVAGMNSVGIGGTNVHLLVEEAPERVPADRPADRPEVVLWSARTEPAAAEYRDVLAAHLDTTGEAGFGDTVGTLQDGRTPYPVRVAVVAAGAAEAAAALRDGRSTAGVHGDQPRPMVLLFPGQAAQYPRMAAGLYRVDDTFTTGMDACLELFGADLRGPWLSGADVTETGVAQPLLFAVQYALARMWLAWGVRPVAMLGHSVGELAAAAVAGVFALPDAVRLVGVRAAAMSELPRGGMLAVATGVENLPDGLPDGVTVAVVNGPRQVVLAGPNELLEAAAAVLTAAGTAHRKLATSHAFHSPAMEPARERLADAIRGMALHEPTTPLISAASGARVTDAARDADFWSGQVTRPVRFDRALDEVLGAEPRLLLEVGPGRTLTALVRQHPAAGAHGTIAGLGPGRDDEHRAALAAAATLWTEGHDIDWPVVRGRRVRRVPVPGYRYQRNLHWLPMRTEAPREPAPAAREPAPVETAPAVESAPFSSLTWVEQPGPHAGTGASGAVAVALLPGDTAAALPVVLALQQAGYRLYVARPGPEYAEVDGEFRVRPEDAADLDRMLNVIAARAGQPALLAHGLALPVWSVPDPASIDGQLGDAFHSLVALAQAGLRRTDVGRLLVFATRSVDVTGAEPVDPLKAALHGVVRTLAQEAPDLDCRLVDVTDSADADLAAEIANAEAPPVVALRGPARWVRVERPYHPEPAPPLAVRRDGVYLLTGGLGGLGRAVARELAGTGLRPHLVLVGRRGLPDPVPPALASEIVGLERLGARVRVEVCDIADRRATRRLLDRLRAHLGALHGVVHLAGVPGGAMLVRRRREDAEAVLRPKVLGTMVLAELLADLPPLDFFVSFSSRAATDGLVGSADYAAGNAFVDAYTRTLARTGLPALSVNWPSWHTVGMAAGPDADGCRWETVLRAEDSPVLDEHRLGSAPVLPGSGQLDLVVQAFREAVGPAGTPVTFTEVVFPQVLDCTTPRRVTVAFERAGDDWAFRATSVPADNGSAPVVHVTGLVRAGAVPPSDVTGLDVLRKRLATPVVEDLEGAPRLFTLGPRWQSVERVTVSPDHPGERLVDITLAEKYHGDLARHALHPVLLDIATSDVRDPVRDGPQIPFRYGSMAVYENLPGRFTSHIRRRPSPPGMIIADVELYGDDGRLLASIAGYTMRAVGDDGLAGSAEPVAALPDGIAPADGARLFRSLLGGRHPYQVVVRPFRAGRPVPLATASGSTMDPLPEVATPPARSERPVPIESPVSVESPARFDRPAAADVSTRLARLWTQVLGIDGVGAGADFFELGGNSLTAVELMGLVRDEFGIRLSVVTMFENPTLDGFAQALAGEGAR